MLWNLRKFLRNHKVFSDSSYEQEYRTFETTFNIGTSNSRASLLKKQKRLEFNRTKEIFVIWIRKESLIGRFLMTTVFKCICLFEFERKKHLINERQLKKRGTVCVFMNWNDHWTRQNWRECEEENQLNEWTRWIKKPIVNCVNEWIMERNTIIAALYC